jgi:hypothetical protein
MDLRRITKKTFLLCAFSGAIDYGAKTLDIKFDRYLIVVLQILATLYQMMQQNVWLINLQMLPISQTCPFYTFMLAIDKDKNYESFSRKLENCF